LNKALSVLELSNQLKGLLETTFCTVYVEGEISNLTYHNSGHIYFSIKDKDATISCVMFKGNATKLKFRLEVGAKIVISGSITVYTPRGNYQLLCSKIEPSGIGSLALAYEQLKTQLQIKGYFNKAIKKNLPTYPKTIYIITSNTGAAIQDMKKILTNRYPLCQMVLISTLVQGEDAKHSIVNSLKKAQELAINKPNCIIILGRGGGSIEDLWAFNEEIVADAIYKCNIPIISAVGHENDFVISDFVADVRASTPSNAIEISTPHINDLRLLNDNVYNDIQNTYRAIIYNKEQELKYLFKSFSMYSIASKFEFVQNEIKQTKQNLNTILLQKINEKDEKVQLLHASFLQNNPENKQRKSYVQVTKNNKLVDVENLNIDDSIQLESSKSIFHCKIIKKQKLS
jgi:exodeoxyribonuclease VII large subunit